MGWTIAPPSDAVNHDTTPKPTFPISNWGSSKNPQSLTLTIVRTLWNAFKYAIALLGYLLVWPLVVHRLGLTIRYGFFAILSEWATV